MRIVLLNPPFSHYASIQPSLGLAYLAMVAKTKGAEVKIIDAHADKLSSEETERIIVDYVPDVVGVTITTPVFDAVIKILKKVREKISVFVIAGGAHPSAMPEETLEGGFVDVVCVGEGEETFKEIIDYLRGKNSLKEIAGIKFLDKGRIFSTQPRSFVKDLDRFLFPDWDEFKLNSYFSPARKMKITLPIMTSRGCPSDCYFCYKDIFGNKYRYRSPRNVVAEIKHLKTMYKIQEFSIIDDNFALLNERAEKICKLIIDEEINLPWSLTNGIRVSPLSESLLKLMKKSGCYRVFFGAETGDEEILKKINKDITLKQVRQAVELTKKSGLEAGVFFMIGNLGEDEAKINKTIEFAIKLDPDFAQFTIATPYPGTKFYDKVKNEGRFLFEEWEEVGSYKKAIFEHGALTAKLIDRKFKEAYRRFYLRPKFIVKKLKRIKTFKDVRNIIEGVVVFTNIEKIRSAK